MNDGGGGSYPPGMDTGRGRGRGVSTTAGRGGQIFKVHGGDVARLVASEPGTGVTRLSCTHYTGVTRDCQPLFFKSLKNFFSLYMYGQTVYIGYIQLSNVSRLTCPPTREADQNGGGGIVPTAAGRVRLSGNPGGRRDRQHGRRGVWGHSPKQSPTAAGGGLH